MPDPRSWIVERIGKRHERRSFDCGVAELNDFLARYARQNDRLGLGRTFVAVRSGDPAARVFGYFTLSTSAIELADLPEESRRRLPRYPVPVVLLGRLAVDRSVQGQGLGELLLVTALEKALTASESVGAMAVEVLAAGSAAKQFYERYGFGELTDDRLHLFLSMKTVAKLFRDC